MIDLVTIRRAILSVSDKTDLVALAKRLVSHHVELISTGGTARALAEAGLPVTPVDKVTGFPEMMDGRLKTLHPKIHGGLLALRDDEHHVAAMNAHGIAPIDLVCVNLYPFEATVAKDGVTEAQAIEQIDIGGPSMIRSAAKNHRFVAVVTDPSQYDELCNDLDRNDGATSFEVRRKLATAAFARTAAYDTAIAEWMTRRRTEVMPDSLLLRLQRDTGGLRYGENPHQAAAFYISPRCKEPSVACAKQLHGKTLSFNNLYDANGALELVKEFDGSKIAAAAVIKHANPCGLAVARTLEEAFTNAYAADPLAAFGGIVALNRDVDLATAKAIVDGQKFLEVIIAPAYDADALDLLRQRWQNVRLLAAGPLTRPDQRDASELDMKRVVGGMLVQQRDLVPIEPEKWEHKAGPPPSESDLQQLALATIAVRHLKSNAVSIVNDHTLVGGGMGQVDRVAACRLAIERAGDRAKGGYVGSDAFFPFRDGPDLLIAAGIKAIAQPGGSKRDDETIAACNAAAVTLMFTSRRHFRH